LSLTDINAITRFPLTGTALDHYARDIICMGDDMLTHTSSVLVVLLLTAAVTVSVSSPTRGESLVAVVVISLELWDALYLMASWLAEALLSP
jgi:hypothetical protein